MTLTRTTLSTVNVPFSPTSPHASQQLRQIAVQAAHSAAGILRAQFRRMDTVAEHKTNHHDLVTQWDLQVEHQLIEQLRSAVPHSEVWGEETGQPLQNPDNLSGVQWIIDPLDGTSNFTHGFAMFSISVAAVVSGTVRAGVVLDPVNSLEFSADDDGAYLGGHRLQTRPCPPGGEKRLNLVTSFPAAEVLHRNADTSLRLFGELVQRFATVRRTVSGALELAYTAAGWADVTLGVDTKPWDVAAGQLILTRAGGSYLPGWYTGSSTQDHDSEGQHPHLAPCYLGVAPGRNAPSAQRALEQITRHLAP